GCSCTCDAPKSVLARAPFADVLQRRGREREDDDGEDDVREIVLDPRDVAEEESRVDEKPDPQRAAGEVERDEAAVVHLRDAREEGRERAHDGREAADDDGEAAVLLVETPRTLQILRLEPAR